ncbi:hypothetical protein CsSME_00054197 [Camellia sinensis var. sinensis]
MLGSKACDTPLEPTSSYAPHEAHLDVVMRILRCLKSTFVGGNLVTWWSKKHNVIARSSAETEFRARAQAHNPVQHNRTKHVEIDHHFIKEKLTNGTICTPFVKSSKQLADILTKGVGSRRKGSIPGQRLLSNRMVRCFTNVEAFTLRAADIEEVTNLFSRFLRNPRVQGAIRYESPYWRGLAARRIQVAWRYRKKRLNRADTANSEPPTQSFI